ncbi:MAG TPA: amidohydrolase family protein [Candidatus Acidoferrum sp.]|nr:amidohydrolase family protein [Candidatus Acidoferrum sp.]
MSSIPVTVDAHQHFWRYHPTRQAWITEEMAMLKRDFLPKEFAAECDANGITASVAVQTDQSEDETSFLLDLAEQNQRIAGVVGWVDLESPGVEERLRHFSSYAKLRGLRHIAQSEPDDRFLVKPTFIRGISRLREFRLTYDMLIYPRQLPAAIELASRFPDQPFVLDHLAKPDLKIKSLDSWAAQIHDFARNKNVFCKLSGLVTEARWKLWKPEDFAPCLDVAFEAFGPDRLLFGSDWPVCLLAASYRQVMQIIENYVNAHAARHRECIFGGNAIRFYGLKAAAHGLAA